MKPIPEIEKEILKVYDNWLHSYLNGDVETYDKYLDDAFHFIGSTSNEEFLNRTDTTKFFAETAEQLAGKSQLRNETKIIEQFGELVFITHLFDAWFMNGTDWSFYARYRFTNALQKNEEGWRFIYQHYSTPDSKAQEGETIGFDQVSKQNLELREAIQRRTVELEEKNRELEIESALAKIRAEAVAMKTSSDLLDIVVTMRKEFIKLGHEAHYFWHMMWLPDTYEKAMTSGDGTKIGMVMELPRDFHSYYKGMDAWEKGSEPIMILPLETDAAIDYVNRMVTQGNFQLIDPNAPTEDDLRHIGGVTFIMARTTHGEIGYSLPGVVRNPPKEDLEILQRFAGAFDLANRRFLDLQKAEKQAREVQIELALEKVRSRTMAMQRSEELRDTAMLLFEQVEALGITSFACGFNIWDEDKKAATAWMASKDRLQPLFKTNSAEDVYLLFLEAEKRGESLFILEQEGKELEDHYKYLKTIPEVKNLSDASLFFPRYQIIHCAYFSKGYLMFITLEPVPEAQNIFKRFASVFEQTYTRFLDLEKAEAQAREAQIEVALERVRARAMAMHKSEELGEAAELLYEELRKLGLSNFINCGYVEIDEENNCQYGWMTNSEGKSMEKFNLPLVGEPILQMRYDAWLRKESVFCQTVGGVELKKHMQFANPQLGSEEVLEHVLNNFTNPTIFYNGNFSHGYLSYITSDHLTPEEESLLVRFTGVFEMTYKRFLDLQNAEAQAREAQIEAALERLRSRSLAMHHSSELSAVVDTLLREFTNLEFTLTFCIINLIDPQDMSNTVWAANPETGKDPESYYMKFEDYPFHHAMWDAWKAQKKRFVYAIEGEEKKEYDEYLYSKTEFRRFSKHVQEANKSLERYVAGFTFFKYSGLQTVSENKISDEDLEILERFGRVFEQAYTRFLDLQKAEDQAREAQIEVALERIRSRSMAMHQTGELSEVIIVLFKQFELLGLNVDTCYIDIFDQNNQEFNIWIGTGTAVYPQQVILPYFNHPIHQLNKSTRQSGLNFFTFDENKKSKDEYFEHFYPNAKGIHVPKDRKEYIDKGLGMTGSTALGEHSGITMFNYSKIIYSCEENDILIRINKVFQQTYTRFLDLQKAEAQAREAQIEASLERVRSRAMAIRESHELSEVIQIIFHELGQLDINLSECSIVVYDTNPRDLIFWSAGPIDTTQPSSTKLQYIDHPILVDLFKDFENGVQYRSGEVSGEILKTWWERVFSETEFRNAPIEFIKEWKKVKNIFYSQFAMTHGFLEFLGVEPLQEEKVEILRRFTKVIDLTYTRYDDVVKAEAQAREAQIEAALERVRSRSMAMHKTDELAQVVTVLFEQFSELKLDFYQVWINIFILEEGYSNCWFSPVQGVIDKPYTVEVPLGPFEESSIKSWRAGEEFSYLSWTGLKEINAIMRNFTEITGHPSFVNIQKKTKMNRIEIVDSNHKYGVLAMAKNDDINDNDRSILKRFTKVFEQTYTRFLDLQKAEEQAREAQIEVALERVRSKTMAMHKSEELGEVAAVLLKQISIFTNIPSRFNIAILNEPKHIFEIWVTGVRGENLNKRFVFDIKKSDVMAEVFKSWKAKEPHIIQHLTGNRLAEWIKYAGGESGVPFEESDVKEHRYINSILFKQGFLGITTNEIPSSNVIQLLQRFTKVFEQTYTRFLDLQKAEAREREAVKQASLDRVRAEIASMRNATDLQRITPLVWSELQSLGVHFFRCGVMIVNEDTNILDFYLSNPEGKALAALHLDFDNSSITRNGIDYWRKKEIYIEHWNQKQFIAFMEQLLSQGQISNAATFQGGERPPSSLTLQFVPFTQGMVYVGSELALSKEALELVEALGKSLSVAYARYEDFTKLDLAKARAEKALLDLKAVQEQLIQQEKLASLGQLTAGIAHEIKNPLNFVNNFSDLSRELIEEVFEELEHITASEAKEEIIELLNDVRSNLTKVHEHGSRADGIVTSMLQHSRASSSKREPKPFNPLVKEFVNLSFHGMRAGKSPINVKINLQLDPKVGDVTLISEDFSRVILNLSNNAFDAMRDKLNHANKPSDYLPELTVKTRIEKDVVILSIGDNGPGISKNIQDKILQPFFTTKKGTEGTGLGLSITNDIIKAHGGNLSLTSELEKGTTFKITLPIKVL